MSQNHRPKILVVDDTPENLDLLVGALKADYAVVAARNGEIALRLAHGEPPPDLILLDIMMPEIDGYEVCRRLKADELTRNIPIMFVTGLTDSGSELKGLNLGAMDYIHKPFALPLVQARVANLISLVQTRNTLSLYASAFEHTSDGIFITRTDGIIVTTNPSFERITGYSQAEAVGRTPAILKSGHHSQEFYEALWGQLEHQGTWSGEIWNRHKDGHVYPERLAINAILDPRGKASHYLAVFADITREKEHEFALIEKATHDKLTGLPNRHLFHDRLDRAIQSFRRDKHRFALLFIDLDRFKPINDEHGHEVGDQILEQVAGRMRLCLRDNDTLARYGGDEFMVLSAIAQVEDAQVVAKKIIESLNQPYRVGELELSIGCSIGIAPVLPEDDGDSLIRRADGAMYQAKKNGRNRCHIDRGDPE